MPIRPSWNATLHPMTPAPTTITDAFSTMGRS